MAERNPNGWLVTFSDMISLLLTFFVLLISMSSFDTQKFKSLSTSVGNALISGTGLGIFKKGGTGKFKITSRKMVLNQLRRGLPKEILASLTQHIEVIPRKNGWTLRIPANVLFAPNSVKIAREAYPILDKIALLLKKILANVEIRGYADSWEKNKWELSGLRAARILHYFIDVKGLDPNRFVIKAYGDTQPISTNRQKNRRVEIIIKKKKFIVESENG